MGVISEKSSAESTVLRSILALLTVSIGDTLKLYLQEEPFKSYSTLYGFSASGHPVKNYRNLSLVSTNFFFKAIRLAGWRCSQCFSDDKAWQHAWPSSNMCSAEARRLGPR